MRSLFLEQLTYLSWPQPGHTPVVPVLHFKSAGTTSHLRVSTRKGMPTMALFLSLRAGLSAANSFLWDPVSTRPLGWRVWEGFHNGIHWSHSSSTSSVMFRTACLKHPTISADVWQSVLRTDNQTYHVTRKFCGVLIFAILPAISKNISSNKHYRKHFSRKNLLQSKYSLT